MTYNIGPLTVSPGVPTNNILKNAPAIQAIKLTNGTQFDLQFFGFGTAGGSTCPAGLEYMLHASEGNDGYINLLPIDSLGVGGSGVVNMVVYLLGEDLPKGSWPATVPAQRVITPTGAGAVVADHLINTGNAASASAIISIQEAGATGQQLFADNQGNLIDSQYVGGVLTTLFRIIAGAANATDNVLISDALHVAHILGLLTVDKSTYFAGATNSGAAQTGGIPAHLVSGFGSGGSSGYTTQSGASDTNWTSFFAQHTGAGAGNPQGSYGFRFSGDALAAFIPDINPFSSANGSVAGNMQIYCPIWGTGLKIGLVIFNALNTASNVTVLFPSASITFLWAYVASINAASVSLYNGAAQLTWVHLLTLGGAGAAGTTEAITTMKANNIGFVGAAADRFVCTTTGGAVSNQFAILIGR